MSAGSRSIELGVPPQVVWELLVAPGLRDWYYSLIAEGEFLPGAHIHWVDADNRPVGQ